VEQLEAVSAVALVVEPATTRGLGESRGWSGSRLGVRFLAETVPSRNLGRWLAGGGMSRATEHALARMRTLVERLGRSDRRKAALLLEVAEAGLLGDADGDGEITSGIGSPPTAEVARRSRLVKAIKRILMDQTLVFDDALGQAIALLDDPDSIDDDDDAEDMDAEESRQGRPHVSYAMVNAQIKAAAIVQRQLRESHQGRARPPAPSEPAALGRWLTGRL
jgi:hypothetical protein